MNKIVKSLAVIASSLIMSVSSFAGELASSGSANASYVVSGGGGANNDDKGLGISNELMFKASGELDNGYILELPHGIRSKWWWNSRQR